ncbi:MAG TPA: trehalose-6-phosphate synthase [Roseiflexaceae bacterium]|nr:trehalose-6-phosphate synthase [Roseiflexaceae bacterium]
MTRTSDSRLIVVSNRLPIVLAREPDGGWQSRAGSGGLVTALAPVLRARGGVWVGWTGVVTEDMADGGELPALGDDPGYSLVPVPMSAWERDHFYLGFSNEIIWPLFHDLLSHCVFSPDYWMAYEAVNRTFAERVAAEARPADTIWVHDYHLMQVGQELRALEVTNRLSFFLHIPFPPPDIFLKLPWREQVLRALLAYDLVGFQTERDRQNFVGCVRTLFGELVASQGEADATVHMAERSVRLGSFPIGIDNASFAQAAAEPEVTAMVGTIRATLPNAKVILGVDRLDYTKGIIERLEAFRNALERYPELRGRVTLFQMVVPSRTDIAGYANLKMQIERLIGEINGQFTRLGWVPVHYVFRSLDRSELLAFYRTADIALVTPLKDGMNLVAKEYCACSIEDGVLILSEFAGAADQLGQGALLVNPYDIEGVADAIARACSMPEAERQERMRTLRRLVRQCDVFWWVDTLLAAAGPHEPPGDACAVGAPPAVAHPKALGGGTDGAAEGPVRRLASLRVV